MEIEKKAYDISVIIPVYNAEKYLIECLRSLGGTKSGKCQIIIVNDGSTDKSLSICMEFAKKNNDVIVVSQKNSGVTAARIAGAKVAMGKYIFCVDGDDFLLPGAMDKFLEDANLYNADIISYGYCDKYGEHVALAQEGEYTEEGLNELKKNFFSNSAIGDENGGMLFYPLWTKFIKKELFIEWQYRQNNELTIGEDAVLSYQCLCSAQSVLVSNYVGYYYRINDFSAMNKFDMNRFEKNDLFVEAVKKVASEQQTYQYIAYHSLISTIKALANSTSSFLEFYRIIKKSEDSICWRYVKKLQIHNPRKETLLKELIIKKRLILFMWFVFKRR